jgi:hypothetical protein
MSKNVQHINEISALNREFSVSLLCLSCRTTILSQCNSWYMVRGKGTCVHYEPKSCIVARF